MNLSLINNEDVMGEFKNSRFLNVITCIAVAVLIFLTILMLIFSLPMLQKL